LPASQRRIAFVVTGAVCYAALVVAVLAEAPALVAVVERLPRFLGAIFLMVIGPPILFAGGSGAWPVFVTVLALFATCLGLSRLAWKRWPESEWFGFWLLCAAVVWAGSPWLLVVVAL
jgi:hypothetical protein